MDDLNASTPAERARTASIRVGMGSFVFIRRLQYFLHGNPTIIPAFVLVLSAIVFSALVGNRFFAAFNLSLVLQQITIIAIVGIAQTLIILTAGIDLSVGAILVLSSVVMGRLAYSDGLPIIVVFPVGLLVGLACGFINGALITLLRLPPFIVTLGSWNVFYALAVWYSHGETIREVDIQAAAPFLLWAGNTFNVFGAQATFGSLLMIALYVLFWYVLRWTAFGTHIHAAGDDPVSARLAGIRTRRMLMAVYGLAGVLCAIAGWVLIGRTGVINSQAGYTSNLDSITAAVIGGTSLFGGRGSILGTMVGALIVGVFHNGLALYGVDVLWQQFTIGLLIVIAVTIDQWIRQISS
jgi:fructose transport system permease protein